MSEIKVCSKCILTNKFPNISFSDKQVCNYCEEYDMEQKKENDYEKKFLELIESVKGQGEYDCLLAFSGGKDSTYTLSILKEKYDLNILTYTFDNGFLSQQAKENIKVVTENIGVDNIIFSPRIDLIKDIFTQAVLNDEVYSNAALMRASAVCTTCINFIRYNVLKVCVEKKIPLLIFGWAPGQIDKRSIIFRPNNAFLRKSQNIFIDSNKDYIEKYKKSYFLSDERFEDNNSRFPYFVNPLLFNEYNYDIVKEKINKLGWSAPKNTDASSTNCLLNTLGNYVHEKKFGFNPYAKEISELIRCGVITREEGLNKINKKLNEDVLNSCLNKLNIRIENI